MTNLMDAPDVIENATVYTNPLWRNECGAGEDEFYGKDNDLVVKKAKSVMQNIDQYRSPRMGREYQNSAGYWRVSVKWFGLGD